MFKKTLDETLAGDNVGVLLRGVQKKDIERGMVLAKPGTITPHTKFEAQVYILNKRRRWASFCFLSWISTSIFCTNNRCYWSKLLAFNIFKCVILLL